jgi:hypothetical protein
VDPEKGHVDDQGDQNERDGPGRKVLSKVLLRRNQNLALSQESATRTIECPFLMSRRSQRSMRTATPMVATVRMPLTLDAHVHAINTPVATSQPHQPGENSLE